ncbi:MAG: protein kinase [Lentisphaeria bacterium]|nr:protein kinase [Lentisphaeria bacterium]
MTCNVGDTICNCTLLQKCGEGAYGEVWLAHDAIGTQVALKIIKNGGRYSERELAGLQNYKDCNHPNLLKIRYVEITDAQIICIMDAADDLNHGNGEYLPDTLANRLRKYGRLDGKEITDMLDGLLSGLEELHKNGLVHRDIKPDNILWVNGRATLADVGLIAFEGTGSLVGTPGFLSPRVLEGNPAEASDDFYALGKVIYCALTGLAVTEYPSLPIDVTISMDANLNKALRESCSHPVKSTAEFRNLLNGKSVSVPSEPKIRNPFPIKKLVMVSGIVVLIGAFVYLFIQQQKMAEKHIVQPVPVDVEAERKLTQLQNIDNDFQKELQSNVQNFFRKSGWLDNGKMLSFLLDYEVIKREDMQELLFNSTDNPRLKPNHGVYRKKVRGVTPLESKLWGMLHGAHYPDFDVAKVQERQRYWKNRADIKLMLTTDPIMQAVALDAVIRHGINKVLEQGAFRDNEEAELKNLLYMRHALLDPEWGKLQFMSGNFH